MHYGFFKLKEKRTISKMCLFNLFFLVPFEKLSIIKEIYLHQWRVANIVQYSVIMAFCYTGFFVLYHHNQPLCILLFRFLKRTKYTSFRFITFITFIRLPNIRVLRGKLFHAMSWKLSGRHMSDLRWNVSWLCFWIQRSNMW